MNMEKANSSWKKLSIGSFTAAGIFVCIGFYKMLVYRCSEYYWEENINAYVGGDAYNYIINGTYATAYFVLANLFIVLAVGSLILYYLSANVEKTKVDVKESVRSVKEETKDVETDQDSAEELM